MENDFCMKTTIAQVFIKYPNSLKANINNNSAVSKCQELDSLSNKDKMKVLNGVNLDNIMALSAKSFREVTSFIEERAIEPVEKTTLTFKDLVEYFSNISPGGNSDMLAAAQIVIEKKDQTLQQDMMEIMLQKLENENISENDVLSDINNYNQEVHKLSKELANSQEYKSAKKAVNENISSLSRKSTNVNQFKTSLKDEGGSLDVNSKPMPSPSVRN